MTQEHEEDTAAGIVRDHLVESGRWTGPPAALGPTYPLLESGVLDSVGLMRMVAFLEERFGIVVDDVDVLPENFEDIASVVRLVRQKAAAR